MKIGKVDYEIAPDEVEVQVRREVPAGFSYAEDGGDFALLDTQISEELALEGMAREFVRRVQLLRQEADFRIDDRITTRYRRRPLSGPGPRRAPPIHPARDIKRALGRMRRFRWGRRNRRARPGGAGLDAGRRVADRRLAF